MIDFESWSCPRASNLTGWMKVPTWNIHDKRSRFGCFFAIWSKCDFRGFYDQNGFSQRKPSLLESPKKNSLSRPKVYIPAKCSTPSPLLICLPFSGIMAIFCSFTHRNSHQPNITPNPIDIFQIHTRDQHTNHGSKEAHNDIWGFLWLSVCVVRRSNHQEQQTDRPGADRGGPGCSWKIPTMSRIFLLLKMVIFHFVILVFGRVWCYCFLDCMTWWY